MIEELRPLFALPETIVTDNGTCFVSVEIENFFATNGIRHSTRYLSTLPNGLAERAVQIVVQIVKRGLKKPRKEV